MSTASDSYGGIGFGKRFSEQDGPFVLSSSLQLHWPFPERRPATPYAERLGRSVERAGANEGLLRYFVQTELFVVQRD
jgi:hypothetical protein